MKRTVITFVIVLLAAPAGASAALPTGNLVSNPGFEQGPSAAATDAAQPIPGWISNSPAGRALRYGATNFYAADQATTAGAGCRGYVGPQAPADDDTPTADEAAYEVFQDYPLPADNANATVRYGALLARRDTNGDYGVLEVQFLDSNKAVVSSHTVSGQGATANAFTRLQDMATLPDGVGFLRIIARSVTPFPPVFNQRPDGPALGVVDDVKVTFDTTLPGDPPVGCQPAGVSTGSAEPTLQAAKVNGTVDTKDETVRYQFRWGKGSALDQTTSEAVLPASGTPSAVSSTIGPLDTGTSYSYQLVARTVLDGQPGPEIAGEVKTVTTTSDAEPAPVPPKPNDPKKALAVRGPKGGCVKKGRTVKVTAADKAAGIRPLTQFQVRAFGGRHTSKLFKGKLGKPTSTLTLKRFPRQKTRKSKLRLVVAATFGPAGDQAGDAVKRTVRFSYCKAKKRKKT